MRILKAIFSTVTEGFFEVPPCLEAVPGEGQQLALLWLAEQAALGVLGRFVGGPVSLGLLVHLLAPGFTARFRGTRGRQTSENDQ